MAYRKVGKNKKIPVLDVPSENAIASPTPSSAKRSLSPPSSSLCSPEEEQRDYFEVEEDKQFSSTPSMKRQYSADRMLLEPPSPRSYSTTPKSDVAPFTPIGRTMSAGNDQEKEKPVVRPRLLSLQGYNPDSPAHWTPPYDFRRQGSIGRTGSDFRRTSTGDSGSSAGRRPTEYEVGSVLWKLHAEGGGSQEHASSDSADGKGEEASQPGITPKSIRGILRKAFSSSLQSFKEISPSQSMDGSQSQEDSGKSIIGRTLAQARSITLRIGSGSGSPRSPSGSAASSRVESNSPGGSSRSLIGSVIAGAKAITRIKGTDSPAGGAGGTPKGESSSRSLLGGAGPEVFTPIQEAICETGTVLPIGRSNSFTRASSSSMFSRTSSALTGDGFFRRTSSNGEGRGLTPFMMRHSFFGADSAVEVMLRQMKIECTVEEKLMIQEAFSCPICSAHVGSETTTISDQMRSIERSFKLVDTDADGLITLGELENVWAWSTVLGEPEVDEFVADFNSALEHVTGMPLDSGTVIGTKDYLLSFAHCFCGTEESLIKNWNLKKRYTYYRRLGRLFGIECQSLRFKWSKFFYAFASDTLAFFTIPTIVASRIIYGEPSEDSPPTFHDRLTEAQWLPTPYTTFESFHMYLAKLWIPSFVSLMIFFASGDSLSGIGVDEILHPIVHYAMIGSYLSTLSGYEPQRMVLRRLNQALSSESQQDELHANFPFRSHTPEGHAVARLGKIAKSLYSARYRLTTHKIAQAMGLMHALMPIVRRVWFDPEGDSMCFTPPALSSWHDAYLWGSLFFYFLTGGHSWLHFMTSVPSNFVSGYLVYRLVFITSVCFYNDLEFYNKLLLFRASSTAESFLRSRSHWRKRMDRKDRREPFIRFLNLQKHDDLLLWCRIRQLLTDSYTGFKQTQGDVIVTFMLLEVLVLTLHIFLKPLSGGLSEKGIEGYGVLDLRARMDVVCFSIILILIINLKISIHSLRKSDVYLLHNEHYSASIHTSTMSEAAVQKNALLQAERKAMEEEMARQERDELGRMASDLASRRPSSVNVKNLESPAVRQGSTGLNVRWHEGTPRSAGTSVPRNNNQSLRRDGSILGEQEEGAFGAYFCSAGRANSGHVRRGEDGATNWGGTFMTTDEQVLMERTARHIEMFDKPPRLLSFTVSIQFLRYIFLPLLTPLYSMIRQSLFPSQHHHHYNSGPQQYPQAHGPHQYGPHPQHVKPH